MSKINVKKHEDCYILSIESEGWIFSITIILPLENCIFEFEGFDGGANSFEQFKAIKELLNEAGTLYLQLKGC